MEQQAPNTPAQRAYAYSTLFYYTLVREDLYKQRQTKHVLSKLKDLDFIIDEIAIYLLENDRIFLC